MQIDNLIDLGLDEMKRISHTEYGISNDFWKAVVGHLLSTLIVNRNFFKKIFTLVLQDNNNANTLSHYVKVFFAHFNNLF